MTTIQELLKTCTNEQLVKELLRRGFWPRMCSEWLHKAEAMERPPYKWTEEEEEE